MTDNINTAKPEGKKTVEKTPAKKTDKKGIKKGDIAEFFRKYIRVLKLARRPTKEEFWKISAIAALGIVLIGVIGFLLYLLFYYVLP